MQFLKPRYLAHLYNCAHINISFIDYIYINTITYPVIFVERLSTALLKIDFYPVVCLVGYFGRVKTCAVCHKPRSCSLSSSNHYYRPCHRYMVSFVVGVWNTCPSCWWHKRGKGQLFLFPAP